MATKAQILAKAKQLGFNPNTPTKLAALVACVAVAGPFMSLESAVKRCAKKLRL